MIANSRYGLTASPIEIIHIRHSFLVASAIQNADLSSIGSLLLLLLVLCTAVRGAEDGAGAKDHAGCHFGRGGRVRWTNDDGHAQLAFGAAFVDSARGRVIGLDPPPSIPHFAAVSH